VIATQPLQDKLSEQAARLVVKWVEQYEVELKITRKRATKLGDYRHPHNGKGHRITINGDLNEHAFLITFVHELAHLVTWNKYKRRVKPHGQEWKSNYSYLLNYLIAMDLFPQELNEQLFAYMQDPAASSCTDVRLTRILRQYDEESDLVHVEELAEGQTFYHRGRAFIKGPRLRKRFRCVEVETDKLYLFSPIAEVEPKS
jgi:predicted SprT family Zn-dependent metalloprotease